MVVWNQAPDLDQDGLARFTARRYLPVWQEGVCFLADIDEGSQCPVNGFNPAQKNILAPGCRIWLRPDPFDGLAIFDQDSWGQPAESR